MHCFVLILAVMLYCCDLCWTVFAWNRETAVPAEGNGDWQTLICVLVARPTLSNPVPWQNWMAVYLGYTLRMKMLFRGWPVMAHETHTRRRRLWWKVLTCLMRMHTAQAFEVMMEKHDNLVYHLCSVDNDASLHLLGRCCAILILPFHGLVNADAWARVLYWGLQKPVRGFRNLICYVKWGLCIGPMKIT